VAFGGMNTPDAAFPYVDVDGEAGIETVVEHLVAQGHDRIGMLNYDRGWPVGDVRERGYRKGMARAGLDIRPEWIAYTPNVLHVGSVAVKALLAARQPRTAIVCPYDVMAFGVKTCFDHIGIRMGAVIALTGYYGDRTSEFLGITSVRQPVDKVAARVFD